VGLPYVFPAARRWQSRHRTQVPVRVEPHRRGVRVQVVADQEPAHPYRTPAMPSKMLEVPASLNCVGEYLYRLFDSEETLLYAGITGSTARTARA
jgi:hypothetical protein